MPTEAILPEYELRFEMEVVPFGLNVPPSANLRFCFEVFRVWNTRGYANGYAMIVDAWIKILDIFSIRISSWLCIGYFTKLCCKLKTTSGPPRSSIYEFNKTTSVTSFLIYWLLTCKYSSGNFYKPQLPATTHIIVVGFAFIYLRLILYQGSLDGKFSY